MFFVRFFVTTGLLLLFGAPPGAASQVEFLERELPFEVPEGTQLTYGHLRVPENRSDPQSAWIEVPVAILKSRSAKPAPDPLVHVTGGPGSSHLTSAKYTKFIPYLDHRDVVLFEQRGTRHARPSLTCPELDDAARLSAEGDEDSEARRTRRQEAAVACAGRLRAEGIDLDGYRTTEIAADVEDFRRAMGYPEINLLAISFGTKVAQVLMRDHPNTLRSVVLDSVLPLDVAFEEEWLAQRRAALDRLFAACADDSACAIAYPELGTRFWRSIDALAESPRRVELPDDDTSLTITAARILGAIGTDDTSTIPYLPWFADAVARGDFVAIAPYLAEPSSFESGFAMGMRMACWCTDEVPFLDRARVESARERSGMHGQSPYVIDPAICEALGLSPAPTRENEAVNTDLPVLLVAGGLDAATPSVWARALHERWPSSHLVEFPLWGHTPSTNWETPCAQALITRFLQDPTVAPNDPCVEAAQTIDFVTR